MKSPCKRRVLCSPLWWSLSLISSLPGVVQTSETYINAEFCGNMGIGGKNHGKHRNTGIRIKVIDKATELELSDGRRHRAQKKS